MKKSTKVMVTAEGKYSAALQFFHMFIPRHKVCSRLFLSNLVPSSTVALPLLASRVLSEVARRQLFIVEGLSARHLVAYVNFFFFFFYKHEEESELLIMKKPSVSVLFYMSFL